MFVNQYTARKHVLNCILKYILFFFLIAVHSWFKKLPPQLYFYLYLLKKTNSTAWPIFLLKHSTTWYAAEVCIIHTLSLNINKIICLSRKAGLYYTNTRGLHWDCFYLLLSHSFYFLSSEKSLSDSSNEMKTCSTIFYLHRPI